MGEFRDVTKGAIVETMEVIRAAADAAGVPLTHIGPALGRGRTYVHRSISRGSVPQADNLAAMLGVCGYALAAVPVDDVPPGAFVIDPPAGSMPAE